MKKVSNKLSVITDQVSLLPVCGKIFGRLIFNFLYKYLEAKKLLSVHQSGFRSSDSCVNQFLSIVHKLYKAFDAYPTLKTRGVLLDMSKVFDKVWHEGLIFKLKSVGVSDSLLRLIESFLSNIFQRVLLNGQTSEWLPGRYITRLHPCTTFFPYLH